MSSLLFAACPADGGFYELYATGMRSSLFTGFLTLSGFLLAAKTFVVVNMKKEVYDNEKYQENFKTQRRLDQTMRLYGPLESLARSLVLNVALCLGTAASQFTVGLIPSPFAAAVCLALAAAAIVFLAVSLVRIRRNLKMMFYWLDVEARDKLGPASTTGGG